MFKTPPARMIPIDAVMEGLEGLSESSQAKFLDAMNTDDRFKIADYLDVGRSRYCITECIKANTKIDKSVDELEAAVQRLKELRDS